MHKSWMKHGCSSLTDDFFQNDFIEQCVGYHSSFTELDVTIQIDSTSTLVQENNKVKNRQAVNNPKH